MNGFYHNGFKHTNLLKIILTAHPTNSVCPSQCARPCSGACQRAACNLIPQFQFFIGIKLLEKDENNQKEAGSCHILKKNIFHSENMSETDGIQLLYLSITERSRVGNTNCNRRLNGCLHENILWTIIYVVWSQRAKFLCRGTHYLRDKYLPMHDRVFKPCSHQAANLL